MSPYIFLTGLRSIEECLRENPQRIIRFQALNGKSSTRVLQILEMAKAQRIPIEISSGHHQKGEEGLIAVLREYEYFSFDAFLEQMASKIHAGGTPPLVLALDSVSDPQNLGAIIRTAAFMSVDGLLLPKDRSAAITETVYRVASGGLEHLRVMQVVNLVQAFESLKKIGFWTVGFSEHAAQDIKQLKPDFPMVLAIGNEEKGLRPLVQRNCDHLVHLPASGHLQSLNASVAAALGMAWAKQIF